MITVLKSQFFGCRKNLSRLLCVERCILDDLLKTRRELPLNALTFSEIAAIHQELQPLIGAQLQESFQTDHELGLAFYLRGQLQWLWVDLSPQCPVVIRLPAPPGGRKKLNRPLSLFLRAHFFGRKMKAIEFSETEGRILRFQFHRAKDEGPLPSPQLEFRLFPHGQNIIAELATDEGNKTVAMFKPKEISAVETQASERAPRPWLEIEAAWHNQKDLCAAPQSQRKTASPAAPQEKIIAKKTTALARMREDLAQKDTALLREAGEWLKSGDMNCVPLAYQPFIDAKKSVAENLAKIFRRAKDLERKRAGTLMRIAKVEKEIAALETGEQRLPMKEKPVDKIMQLAKAKGRRHLIGEDLEVFVGKSAKDNLALLRRAQSFDLWLHLRDLPGAYAIVRRTRGRLVTDAELALAGRWVVEQSLGKNASELAGSRHDLLVVECRFVRPIKGDRLGRVTFSNDRLLTIRL